MCANAVLDWHNGEDGFETAHDDMQAAYEALPCTPALDGALSRVIAAEKEHA
jgi:hypothetical protein